MIAAARIHPSIWDVVTGKARAVMDVILHIGAHRTGTTSFQHYMRSNAARLRDRGLGFWGPVRTRGGLFAGILPKPGPARGRDLVRRGVGRVRMQCEQAAQGGLQTLLVSDENMIGSVRANLRMGELYPGIGERMARYAEAFGTRVTDVALGIRGLDTYWASAAGYGITRGCAVPAAAALTRLVEARRSWRDVITDVACAVPDVRLHVLSFESFGARPEAALAAMTGLFDPPLTEARVCRNATPHLPELRRQLAERGDDPDALPDGEGRWRPFDAAQLETLRERYLDDLFWLHSGADGLAILHEEMTPAKTGPIPQPGSDERGPPNDSQERAMAQPR